MPYSPGSVYGESLGPDPPGTGAALTAFPASDRGLRVPVQWNIVPVHISVRLSYAGVTGLQEAGARRMKNMVKPHILWGKTVGKGFGRVYRFCQTESNTVVSGRFECLSRCKAVIAQLPGRSKWGKWGFRQLWMSAQFMACRMNNISSSISCSIFRWPDRRRR